MASVPRADSSGETEIQVVRIETNVVPVPIIGLRQSTSFGVVTSESKQKTFNGQTPPSGEDRLARSPRPLKIHHPQGCSQPRPLPHVPAPTIPPSLLAHSRHPAQTTQTSFCPFVAQAGSRCTRNVAGPVFAWGAGLQRSLTDLHGRGSLIIQDGILMVLFRILDV